MEPASPKTNETPQLEPSLPHSPHQSLLLDIPLQAQGVFDQEAKDVLPPPSDIIQQSPEEPHEHKEVIQKEQEPLQPNFTPLEVQSDKDENNVKQQPEDHTQEITNLLQMAQNEKSLELEAKEEAKEEKKEEAKEEAKEGPSPDQMVELQQNKQDAQQLDQPHPLQQSSKQALPDENGSSIVLMKQQQMDPTLIEEAQKHPPSSQAQLPPNQEDHQQIWAFTPEQNQPFTIEEPKENKQFIAEEDINQKISIDHQVKTEEFQPQEEEQKEEEVQNRIEESQNDDDSLASKEQLQQKQKADENKLEGVAQPKSGKGETLLHRIVSEPYEEHKEDEEKQSIPSHEIVAFEEFNPSPPSQQKEEGKLSQEDKLAVEQVVEQRQKIEAKQEEPSQQSMPPSNESLQNNPLENPLNLEESPPQQEEDQHETSQLNGNHHQRLQHLQNQIKSLDIHHKQHQIQEIVSPGRQAGKISKKDQPIHQKKVHQIIKDLQKTDQIHSQVPVLQPKRIRKQRFENLQRIQGKIVLESNVMNLTVGQIICDENEIETKKLMSEIRELKEKLSELQQHHQQEENLEDSHSNNSHASQRKLERKSLLGKIYKKNQINTSRVSEHSQTFHGLDSIKKNSIDLANPESNHKFSATMGASSQHGGDTPSGKGISFRVKKQGRDILNRTVYEPSEKEIGFIRSPSKDHLLKRNISFSEEERIVECRDINEFTPAFREEVEAQIVDLGSLSPKPDWSQRQLIELAKETFLKFGISIDNKHNAVLNVKKYKNCVSFDVNNEATILWYYEGKFYFGGWKNIDGEGEKQGYGYELVPEKYVYFGHFLQNKRNGKGTMKLLSQRQNIIYSGEWKDGYKQGQGKQIQADGSQYIGQWHEGKKHGFGRIKVTHKEYFEGHFLKGIRSGEGEEHFQNGDVYKGAYLNGKFNGYGLYQWANNSNYHGDFVKGLRQGHGKWCANRLDPNSDCYEGEYSNDKKNGHGVYTWKDGTVYDGEFMNDLKHGMGTVKYGDGKTVKFQWVEGTAITKVGNKVSAATEAIGKTLPRGGSRRNSAQMNGNNNSLNEMKKGESNNQYRVNETKSNYTRQSLKMQKI